MIFSSMPTRTAIIGLSATATTSWAANAHLPGLRRSAQFQIAALCNSSLSAAEAAIEEYQLDASSVTPYGSPIDLAADRTIDLVICSTRVDRHYETALPMIQAGKATYIEWPIAGNATHIEELLTAARRSGSPVAVGLQSRFAPPVRRIRDLLESASLGRLLNTEVRAFGGTLDREFLPPGLAYFAQRSVGGNPITIGFAHDTVIDFVQSVVGDVIPETDHIQFQLQRPDIRVRDPTTGSVVETIRSDVPDLVSLHGHLPASAHVAPQASLVAYFSRGQPYPGDPQLEWTLTCEQGAIRLTAPAGIVLGANTYAEPVTISLHRFDTGETTPVPWAWSPEQEELPVSARSVQSCLLSLAEGNSDGYVSLEQAAARARQIARWLDSFPAGRCAV
ncbi:Gfo/Idh/MocA family protein [Aspergillus saccharolyticus JOP 1030-1]|uniref:Putative oxidoreductase n=1 Tax=Aspergillus saccharolyticus JOP 1030-1 TaxID=1450539 RepID=A0A318ZS74_9EURO|nr:putative oxidoreductase [Aspergillus saccharolyticus JOP 1030-1]PYH49454.1 putative oxidoreductase [Aspergillus saccharolyticus JOP 1030-1]